jgi:ribonucleoside-triphosphate reductase
MNQRDQAAREAASRSSGESALPRAILPDSFRHAADHLLQYGLTGAQSYNLLYLLRPEISTAHQAHDLLLHDLAYYLLTFADFPLDLTPLLARQASEAESGSLLGDDIRSCTAKAVAAATRAQAEISGYLTLIHFDRTLANGVRATRQQLMLEYESIGSCLSSCKILPDEGLPPSAQLGQLIARMTEKTTHQAMASLLDPWQPGSFLAMSRRSRLSVQYGLETDEDARQAIRQLLLATGAMASGQDPAGPARLRPQQVFLLSPGVNFLPGDPNYDLFQLALDCCAKTGSPAFALADPTPRSLSTVTINLPRCAILARYDLNLFYQRLDKLLDLAANALLDRLAVLQSIHRANFPLLGELESKAGQSVPPMPETIADLLDYGHLSIGFVGLAETLTALTGRHHGQRSESARLGLEIVGRLKAFCSEATDQFSHPFKLLAGHDLRISRELAAADRARFGRIAGVTDQPAYTSGFSLPENLPIPPVERIRLEAPYHDRVDCGQVLTVGTKDLTGDLPAAFEAMLRVAASSGIRQVLFAPSHTKS